MKEDAGSQQKMVDLGAGLEKTRRASLTTVI